MPPGNDGLHGSGASVLSGDLCQSTSTPSPGNTLVTFARRYSP